MTLDVVTFGEAMLLLVADRPGPIEEAESFVKRTAGDDLLNPDWPSQRHRSAPRGGTGSRHR